MTEQDRQAFGGTIEALCANFNREPTKALLTGYWIGLADLTLDEVQVGAARAFRESKFMPTAAEIRTLAGEIGPKDRALVAWRSLYRAIEGVGPYHSPEFDDPTIHACVRSMGGWERLCGLEAEALEIHERKRFEAAYISFWINGIPEGEGDRLVGLFESDNRRKGLLEWVPEPRQIAVPLPPKRLGPGSPKPLHLGGAVRAMPAGVVNDVLDADGESF